MKNGKLTKKQNHPTTAENLISRFDAGKSVIDYVDIRKAYHPNWGGMRQGAGRKPKGNVRLQVLVPPAVRNRIRAIAHRQGKTLSEVIAARF
jgi:hypothetical protein